MEFRLLGPVEAGRDGTRLRLGGPKPRALLAALLLEPGRVVAADRLVDVLWAQRPPATARALIQTYVSALRRELGGLIERRPPGYRINLATGSLDIERFARLVADGRTAAEDGRAPAAAEAFRAALRLWRGPALGGIGEALRDAAAGLDEQRLAVQEEAIAAELVLGRHRELVGELAGLVGAYPTRERLRGLMMTALYRSGRLAEALAAYQECRSVLVETLGVDPGPELQRLHEAMLRADPALFGPAVLPVPHTPPPAAADPAVPIRARAAGPPVVPAQLPPGVADFTGRGVQVADLVARLTSPGEALPICVISGKGGVGKSALAVHVAHRVTAAYPDGQLCVDLRGASELPATPAESAARCLRALGVEPAAVPETLQERVDLFRSLLAGRRVLLMLDDAGTERQVRPLLPGSTTCAVLITARNRLAGLAGAHRTDLDVLDIGAAVDLLSQVAGPERVAADRGAAERIVRMCDCLPLAVRTAGARLATRRHWTLAQLAHRLTDERHRLDELAVGDLEVRASVGLSYRGLDPLARTAFRRLGLLSVPDFAPWVLAPLLDVPDRVAEEVLEQLMDAQLVDFGSVDGAGQARYRLHDLLRVYGMERAEAEEPATDRAAAMARVLGCWVWLITQVESAAPSATVPLRRDYTTARPLGAGVAEQVLGQPLAWYEAEAPALVVAAERAAALDLASATSDLAAALSSSWFTVGSWFEEWGRVHEAALAAARRTGDAAAEATLLAGLGQLRYRQDRFAESAAFFEDALPLFDAAGDTRGSAVALAGLGTTRREQGRLAVATDLLSRAGTAFQTLADDAGIGTAGRLAGSVLLEQGAFDAALSTLDEAVAAYRRLGSRRGEALTLRTIGLVHRATGDFTTAERLSDEAVTLLRDLGDPLMTAYAVQARAKARIRLGRGGAERAALTEAYELCAGHGDRFGTAMLLRTLGELCLAEADAEEAVGYFARALAVWDALGLRLFRARTMRDLAVAQTALGDPAATATRAEAIAIFAEFGSREHAELTR